MHESIDHPLISKQNEIIEKNLYRSYAQNAPKIMLETITARTITICLLVTYSVFLLADTIDIRNIVVGAEKGNREYTSEFCPDNILSNTEDYGCIYGGLNQDSSTFTYVLHASDFENVISLSFFVTRTNISSQVNDDNLLDTKKINYNLRVYGCYEKYNCGNINNSNWKSVINLDQKVSINDIYNYGDDKIKYYLLPITFQNQESLPNQGKVKSYYLTLEYESNTEFKYFQPDDTTYNFNTIARPKTYVGDIFLPFIMVGTFVIFYYYVRILQRQCGTIMQTLSEQRWIIFYFIAMILIQNPVYCVIIWLDDPSPAAVYACYVIEAMASASIFTIWLLFADALNRKKQTRSSFYAPKVSLGAALFVFNLIILSFQFPSLSSAHNTRSPVLAVENWSPYTKRSFIAMSLLYFFFIAIWTIAWFISLYNTSKVLDKLSYMTTRYVQLSFRYVFLVSSLLILYYLSQILVISYYLFSVNDNSSHNYVDTITENINTLFREQTLTYGKMVFLTVYGFTLSFFFLPAGSFDNPGNNNIVSNLVTSLAATYVINESEINEVVQARKHILHKNSAIEMMTSAKAEVFCVDLALDLLEVSYQAYNDTPSVTTENGFGPIDLNSINYNLVNAAYDKDQDTVCYIVRHKVHARVVVAFRGTCSKKHWTSNLKYSQIPLNLPSLKLPALDALDGMDVPTQAGLVDELHNMFFGSANKNDDIQESNDGEGNEQRGSEHRGTIVANTTEMIQNAAYSAAEKTPLLQKALTYYVHEGFWEAYLTVREFIHTVLRVELKKNPAQVFCTGHSLGGALASIAALDIALNSVPRINKYLMYRRQADDVPQEALPNSEKAGIRNEEAAASISDCSKGAVELPPSSSDSVADINDTNDAHRDSFKPTKTIAVASKVEVGLYNFGSPRVGNRAFGALFNRVVPNAFRTVVDGDIVTGIPKTHYKHLGTEVIIDRLGAGSIVIDQSFVERRLRTSAKTSFKSHVMSVYRNSLNGVKTAAEYLRDHPETELHYRRKSVDFTDIVDIESGVQTENEKFLTSSLQSATEVAQSQIEEKHDMEAQSTHNSALLVKAKSQSSFTPKKILQSLNEKTFNIISNSSKKECEIVDEEKN